MSVGVKLIRSIHSTEIDLIVHVEFGNIGIGIPNWLCAAHPPFNSVAAVPEEAVARRILTSFLIKISEMYTMKLLPAWVHIMLVQGAFSLML